VAPIEEQSVPRQGQKRRERFEQRSALARLRAPLTDKGRICAGQAGREAVFCVFAIG